MAKILLSFVIPCYRSEHTIGSVVEELERTVAARESEFDHEIILVNDGSPDDTAGAIRALCDEHPQIVFVNLSKNFGQHSALMAGFSRVRGDIVICLDDDGQTPADECFKLIDKVLEGYDLVYAEYEAIRQKWFRRVGSRFNAICNHYFYNQPRELVANSYYACQRFVVDSALQYPNPFPFVTGLLFQSVSRCCNVKVHHRPRAEGESGYNLRKLIALWANGVTAFSIKPLRFANYMGWLTALGGFLYALFTIIRKLCDPTIETGWASTISVMLLLGGIVIALMGVVGEYIGRIYLSINRCPQYVVRNVLDRRPDSAGHAPCVHDARSVTNLCAKEVGNENHSRDLGA